MTQDRPTHSTQPPEPAAASDAPRNPGRRIILGGIPIAVTLASKPALAMTGQCSVSNVLSGNLSHPLPTGVNCGMTPATWQSLAGTNQLWTRTGFFPLDQLHQRGGRPRLRQRLDRRRAIAALGAARRPRSSNARSTARTRRSTRQLFGEQVAAALLNAAASRRTIIRIRCRKCSRWCSRSGSRHRRSKNQAQSALDSVSTNHLAPLNINT